MNTIMKRLVYTFAAVLTPLLLVVSMSGTASAAVSDPFQEICKTNPSSSVCGADTQASKQPLFGANSIWTKVINTILIVIGSISVIMVIVGGVRYVVSAGDPKGVNSAKDTILYAIVGIIVSIMAGAIVNFVLARIT